MKKIKIEFIKDHEGQGKKVGEFGEYEEGIAKHLIRFGYGEESRLQRPTKSGKEVQADVPK